MKSWERRKIFCPDNRVMQNEGKLKNRVILHLTAIVVFIFSAWFITQRQHIFIYDEVGYLSTGAYIAGYDWSEIAKSYSYYSFGYGLFISIFIKIFNTKEQIYFAILLLNAFLNVFNFYLEFVCTKKVFAEINERVIILCCFTSSLYISNLVYINVIMPEIMLTSFFWAIIYLLEKYMEEKKPITVAFLAILCGLMFWIHMRTIAILFSVGLIGIFLCVKGKIRKSHVIEFVILFVSIIVAGAFAREYIKNGLWGKARDLAALNSNDVGGRINQVIELITSPHLWKTFLLSISAKIYYTVFSSIGVVFLGIYFAIKQYRKREEKHKIIFAFLLCSYVFAMIINCVAMAVPDKWDRLFWGRYVEYIWGPFLILGLLCLFFCKKKDNIRNIMIIIFLQSVLFFAVAKIIQSTEFQDSIAFCSLGITIYDRTEFAEFSLERLSQLLVLLLTIILLFTQWNKKAGFLAVNVLLVCIWVSSSSYYIGKRIADVNDAEEEQEEILTGCLLDNHKGENIYFYTDGFEAGTYNFMSDTKFLLQDYPIIHIDSSEIENYNTDNSFCIMRSGNVSDMKDFEILAEQNGYSLLRLN